MKTFDDLLLDYWFEDFKDFKNALEKSDREWENSLFFWNAIWLLEDLYGQSKTNNTKWAFELWKLVQLFRHTDAQFTETAEKKLNTIREKIWDIVENNSELEELLPSDIYWI